MAPKEKISTTALAPKQAGESGERPRREDRVPAPGEVLAGKYRIEGLLGRGGMGVVVLGRQLELDRPVAIKFLRTGLPLDARPLQRFVREARIIARMRSEHVVRVFDVGRENEVPFIVMERLQGHDLAREIDQGALPVERAVELVLHACEALGEAHSLGIVHRDVKPSNLFVAEGFGGRQSLKVLDFGVSKWLLPSSDVDRALTTDGGAVGTPAYASPEQLARPEAIDRRTDVWALGVVLYQALSGELPFRADTLPSLYALIIGAQPTPFPPREGVPPELVAVIMRCLERDPKDRFESMLELARALVPFAPARAHGIVDSLATLATEASALEPFEEPEPVLSALSSTLEISQLTPQGTAGGTPEPDPDGALPRRGVAGAMALVALVAFGALVWRERTRSPEPPPLPTTRAADASLGEVVSARVEARPSAAEPPVGAPSNPAPSAAVPPPSSPKTRPRPGAAAVREHPSTSTTAAASVAPTASVTAPAPSAPARQRTDVMPLYRH